ncbi:MAG: hypothetical protein ACMUIA_04240 [bacterium]
MLKALLIEVFKAFLIISLLIPSSPVCAQKSTGNVNFFFGEKRMDKDDWKPLDRQTEFGFFEVDFTFPNWPLSITWAYLMSDETGDYFLAESDELHIGLKKIMNLRCAPLHPFVSGGISRMETHLEVGNKKYSDTGAGLWAGTGIYWTSGSGFNIGLMVKYSDADVTFDHEEFEAGGIHYGIMAGGHW